MRIVTSAKIHKYQMSRQAPNAYPRRHGWWPQPRRAGGRCRLGLGADSTIKRCSPFPTCSRNLIDCLLSHPPKHNKCQHLICSTWLLHPHLAYEKHPIQDVIRSHKPDDGPDDEGPGFSCCTAMVSCPTSKHAAKLARQKKITDWIRCLCFLARVPAGTRENVV